MLWQKERTRTIRGAKVYFGSWFQSFSLWSPGSITLVLGEAELRSGRDWCKETTQDMTARKQKGSLPQQGQNANPKAQSQWATSSSNTLPAYSLHPDNLHPHGWVNPLVRLQLSQSNHHLWTFLHWLTHELLGDTWHWNHDTCFFAHRSWRPPK